MSFESPISFHTEEPLHFQLSVPNQLAITTWLNTIIEQYKYDLQTLSYIFCTDEYLYQINVEYLNHHTYTDIITFDNADEEQIIESDIFISIERVKENAAKFDIDFSVELRRVMAHGLLHLLGFKDKSPEEAEQMRTKENDCLALYKKMFA